MQLTYISITFEMYHEYIFADKKVTTKNINQYISMTESQRDSS